MVAVQSYERGDVYNERDAELLTFVSYQIGSSLQRRRAAELLRQANAELEHRVEARTRGAARTDRACANRSKRSCSTR